MKKTLCLFVLSLLSATFPAISKAASFEGVVNFNTTSANGSGTVAYSLKGRKIRIDGADSKDPSRSGSVIMDFDSRQETVILPALKMFTINPMPAQDVLKKVKSQNAGDNVKHTGETQVILGHKCEKWLFIGKEDQGEVWMAKEMGGPFSELLREISQRKGLSQEDWVKDAISNNLFPLKESMKNKNGDVTGSMDVTSIEAQTLSDALFEAPPDYKKVDKSNLGEVMKMMRQQSGKKPKPHKDSSPSTTEP